MWKYEAVVKKMNQSGQKEKASFWLFPSWVQPKVDDDDLDRNSGNKKQGGEMKNESPLPPLPLLTTAFDGQGQAMFGVRACMKER